MELERKKLGPERVLDEDLIARSNRLLNNRLKSTEFKENGKFLNDVGNYLTFDKVFQDINVIFN